MTRVLFAAATCAVLLLGGPSPAAAACTVDYLASLQQVRGDLDSGGSPADVSTLRQIADSNSVNSGVLDPVIADLDQHPPDLDSAKQRLDAILGALAEPPQTACGSDVSAARATLRDVYNSPVFANLDQINTPSPPSRSPLTSVPQWLVIAVLAVIIAAVLAFAIWRLAQLTAAGETDRESGGGGVRESSDPDAEWRLAEEAAARGDHREAIRRAFRSALLTIAAAGRMPVSASWTTRELLGQAAGSGLAGPLAPAADSFDRAWYSGEAVTAPDWETARERCQAVRAHARRAREIAA